MSNSCEKERIRSTENGSHQVASDHIPDFPTLTSEYHAFTVTKNSQLGRYAVADRDLEPGDLVLKESAAAVGPKQSSTPLCLACYQAIYEDNYRCTKCMYPLCSAKCQDSPVHQVECATLSRGGKRSRPVIEDMQTPAAYLECIITIRILHLRHSHPTLWSRVLEMDCSREAWNQSELHTVHQHNVVKFLQQVCKVDAKSELLHQIGGALVTNAFEARSPFKGVHVRCLFPDAALLAHNCTPNVHHTVDDTYTIYIRAARRIKKGEPLFTSYTHTIVGTQARQEHLSYSKFFLCSCARCEDPTEMGLYFSALLCCRCPQDDKGYVLPVSGDANLKDWRCTNCSYTVKASSVRRLNAMLLKELDSLDTTDPIQHELYLRKYANVLHNNHYMMFDARHRLSQIYGRLDQCPLSKLSDVQLRRKIELCEEVISVTKQCLPEISRMTGLAHFELHAPVMELARRSHEKKKISDRQIISQLERARGHLKKAIFILGFEPSSSLEGKVCKAARCALSELQNQIQILSEFSNLDNNNNNNNNNHNINNNNNYTDSISNFNNSKSIVEPSKDIGHLVGSFEAIVDLMK